MVYSDQLPDPKAAKVLQGFDVAEPGDWIQELDRRWRETFGKNRDIGDKCSIRKEPLLMRKGKAGSWEAELSAGLCWKADLPRSSLLRSRLGLGSQTFQGQSPFGCNPSPAFLARQQHFCCHGVTLEKQIPGHRKLLTTPLSPDWQMKHHFIQSSNSF